MAPRKKYYVGKSKIHGEGSFAKKDLSAGEYIGKAHTVKKLYSDYDFTELGMKHNHSENPSTLDVEIGNERHLIAKRPIKKGEELTTNYRVLQDLKQPEDFENGGWLDKYDAPQAQNGIEGTMGGLTDKGFNYNGAWGGPSMQMGGNIMPAMAGANQTVPMYQMGGVLPGAVGFTYARTAGAAPANGPYAKKTKASAQDGKKLSYGQWKKQYNLKETPDYNLKRAWELGYTPDKTGHLPTVDNQTGQFLKAKGHPTIQLELDWYNSPEGAEFRSKNAIDSSGKFFKYVPKGQNGTTQEKRENVSQIWERVTGTPWSEAKRSGKTDGSYKANLALLDELKKVSSEPKKAEQAPLSADKKQSTTTSGLGKMPSISLEDAKSFNDAFKIARDQYGPNQIFEWNGRKYGTNLKGETFAPSQETLKVAGLDLPSVKKNIIEQNDDLNNPFLSKTTVKLEPDKYKDWKEVKQKNAELNTSSNADRIVKWKNANPDNNNYIIIDKSKGLLHVYQPGNSKPLFTSAVDLGANISDAQTVTKLMDTNGDGKIDEKEAQVAKADFNLGNKSTGAGRYYISNIDLTGYSGLPLFNMMNERQYEEFKKTGKIENVATSLHKGFISDNNARVSNGCIRCSKTTLDNLTKYLKNSSEVYILPEEPGNEFVIENNKLNFKAKSKSPYYTYNNDGRVYKKQNDGWYEAEKPGSKFIKIGDAKKVEKLSKNANNAGYNFYEDAKGNLQKGQGVNVGSSLNYVPIKVSIDEGRFKDEVFTKFDFNDEAEFKIVKRFAKSLQDNKQKAMVAAKINGDVYNDIAGIAFGIFGTESNFADTHSAAGNLLRAVGKYFDPKGSSSPDYESKYGTYGAKEESRSVGLTQIRWNFLNDAEKKALKEVGITSNKDFMEPEKAALGTVVILGVRYNQQLNDNQKKDIWTNLPKRWNTRENYPDRVKNNAKYLTIQQKVSGGGLDDYRSSKPLELQRPTNVADETYRPVNQIIPKFARKFEHGGVIKAQNGSEMKFYQEGLDFTPKTISKNGGWLDKYNAPQARDGNDILEYLKKDKTAPVVTKGKPLTADQQKRITAETLKRQTQKNKPLTATNTREQAVERGRAENLRVIEENKEAEEQAMAEGKAAEATRENPNVPFTFPTGETKLWKDMDWRERQYVSGRNLGSMSRFNNWTDWINPITMIGEMGEGLATAPYMARVTESNLPYVAGIASPLLGGALGGLGTRSTGQFANNMLNPVAGMDLSFNKIGEKITNAMLSPFPKSTQSAIRSFNIGLNRGIGEVLSGRPISETFPITKKQIELAKQKATQEHAQGSNFARDWYYDTKGAIRPEVEQKIENILKSKGAPFENAGYYPNYKTFGTSSYAHAGPMGQAYTFISNPLAETPNVLVGSSTKSISESNFPDYVRKYLLEERHRIGGVNYGNAQFTGPSITLFGQGPNYYRPSIVGDIAVHEAGHTAQNLGGMGYDPITGYPTHMYGTWGEVTTTTDPDYKYFVPNLNTELGQRFGKAMVEPVKGKSTWLASPNELHSDLMMARLRTHKNLMNQGLDYQTAINKLQKETMTDDAMVDEIIRQGSLNRFFKKDTPIEEKRALIRLLPAAVPAVGAASMLGGESEQPPKQQYGGDIPVDPMGYWNPENVGGPVTIPSNVISMEGVDQPLLGISDTGDVQYMMPGEDYEFDGEYVTEYPVAKKGISVNNADAQPLKKLDQLLNFTNYNKPTKGGWLDKYN